jgi:hypothetical protein
MDDDLDHLFMRVQIELRRVTEERIQANRAEEPAATDLVLCRCGHDRADHMTGVGEGSPCLWDHCGCRHLIEGPTEKTVLRPGTGGTAG